MKPDQVRATTLGLSGVAERETWGKPTFRVGDRLFATLAADGSTATVKASLGDQAALVAAVPEVFSVAAYAGRFGWVTVRLDGVDPDRLAELVVDAWRRVAPGNRQTRRRGQVSSCTTDPVP